MITVDVTGTKILARPLDNNEVCYCWEASNPDNIEMEQDAPGDAHTKHQVPIVVLTEMIKAIEGTKKIE